MPEDGDTSTVNCRIKLEPTVPDHLVMDTKVQHARTGIVRRRNGVRLTAGNRETIQRCPIRARRHGIRYP